MNTTDILLYESGDGGEMAIISDDLAATETLYQQAYLALFGGNIEANTTNNTLITEERFDYWANALIWDEIPSSQFNSNTERVLNNVALNSSGRQEIIAAVTEDLSYLSDLLTATVDVQLLGVDRLRIIINFTPKNNQQSRRLQFIYNNATNELIIEKTI